MPLVPSSPNARSTKRWDQPQRPLPEPLTRQQTEEAMRYLGQVKRVCPKAVIGA
jgi:hypothetical protein